MSKSRDAFRTISEVADWLGIQAHVLRFWESKFTQVKPIKRAGGRRYYRPADMLLLGGIKKLLHDDGLTIKGVQKLLREEGMSHVAGFSAPLDNLSVAEHAAARPDPAPTPAEKGVVLSFDPSARAEPDPTISDKPEPTAPEELPNFLRQPPSTPIPGPDNAPEAEESPASAAASSTVAAEPQPPTADEEPTAEDGTVTHPAPAPKPRQIALSAFTDEADFPAFPGLLSSAHRLRQFDAETAARAAPLLARLTALRDQMAVQSNVPNPHTTES